MVFYDLLNNRQPDSAAALRRIPGGIRAVKTVEHIGKIFRRNSLSVILDLHLNEVAHILYPDIDIAFRLIHILYRITYNIINYPLQLLCICNYYCIRICIIKIG